MAFVKLDCGILDSSLWAESAEVRVTFLTMLAMAEASGLCRATAPGIARRANLPQDSVKRALAILEAPDPESRSRDEAGRRVTRRDGGYFIINYAKYRSKDHTATERKRRQRKRLQEQNVTRDVTVSRVTSRRVTQAEAEAEADTKKEKRQLSSESPPSPAGAGSSLEDPTRGNGQQDLQLDPQPPDPPRQAANGEEFERWWVLYRDRTGRGTDKRGTLEAYRRLGEADRQVLVERTLAWFRAREVLEAAGVFVPAAPDPIRFIRKRRWTDELAVPSAAGGGCGGERELTDNERLVLDESLHGSDPRWPEYERLVLAHEIPVGWDLWLEGAAATFPPGPAAGEAQRLVDHYAAEFERLKGSRPMIRMPQSAQAAAAVLSGRTFDEAAALVTRFLEAPPTWNAKKGLLRLEDLPGAVTQLLTAGPGRRTRAGSFSRGGGGDGCPRVLG